MPDRHWSFECRAGLRVVRCLALDVSGVGHVFTTAQDRQGLPFDVGPSSTSSASGWRSRVLDAAGLSGRSVLDPHQIHGARVVSSRHARVGVAADGVVAFADESPGSAPAVRSADCVPLLLVARDGRAVAAVHAGWRGAASGIVERAVARLSQGGVPPDSLLAAIGPAIGRCCYQVGEELLVALSARHGSRVAECVERGSGGPRLGLGRLVQTQLIALGLEPASVHHSPWCTACGEIPLFSYRRQGAAAGRQIACVGWLTA